MSSQSPIPDTETLLRILDGSLPEAERARLMADEAVQREVEFLRSLQAAAPEKRAIDEFGWARLQRSIRAEKAASSAPARKPSGRVSVTPWQMAASAVGAFALGTFATLTVSSGAPDAPGYVTASGPAPMQGQFTVAFREDASEGAIRDVLNEMRLQIVAGPSAIGLYRLAGEEGQDLAATLAALTERSDVVESVQAD